MTLEEKIIDFISTHFKGNNNTVTSKDIAVILSGMGYKVNAADVQKIIGDIRRSKKALIGSSPAGFFLIVNDEDMGITQANIKNRIRSIVEAAEGIDEMWREKTGVKFAGDLFVGAYNDK